MRSRIPGMLAIAAFGAVLLTGCGQKKETIAAPTAAPTAAYDLSPESNTKFLADNKARDSVKTTADGLQYRVIKSGSGKSPASGADMVTVTYKGWTIDGKVFDQTPSGQTATFAAGQLIPGWVEALRMMKEGDEWELVIPAGLGYGATGAGDAIGPNQTLVFDMTLISVAAQPPPQQ